MLRTSRFFPELDDSKETRQLYADENVKANEFLHRRVDIEDIVSAHILAIEKAAEIGFNKYIISATSPFTQDDLALLHQNAPQVVKNLYPDYEDEYARRGWRMFPTIGRVYVNERARRDLGWQPKYDFRHMLNCLKSNKYPRSPLSTLIGIKGYHQEGFGDGIYPVG